MDKQKLGRQIDWLKRMIAIKFWMNDCLSIRSIKELRWTLRNPIREAVWQQCLKTWADK